MSGVQERVRDDAIAAARSLPDLRVKLQNVDPDLAKSLTSKALVSSKSVWGNLAALLVSWLVTRYGLQWDSDTCALVTGLITMAMTIVMRVLTRQPISGVMTS